MVSYTAKVPRSSLKINSSKSELHKRGKEKKKKRKEKGWTYKSQDRPQLSDVSQQRI